MRSFFQKCCILIVIALVLTGKTTLAQNFDDFKFNGSFRPGENWVRSDFQFNGYTNYWHDIYRDWTRYGNLFKIATPKIEYTIAQSKIDIAEDLKIPGLTVQEGFFNA